MADPFLKIKQFERLYDDATAAQTAHDAGDADQCRRYSLDAFDALAEAVCEVRGCTFKELLASDYLSELSARNYSMYAYGVFTGNSFEALEPEQALAVSHTDPFTALTEEIDKFAAFYAKGLRPNFCDEITRTKAKGMLTSGARSSLDSIVSMILIVAIFAAGVVLLLLSTSEKHRDLYISGVLAVAFGAFLLFLKIGATKE
ncbi:MAG: hypothetical protein IKX54_00945 [Lachnospiraceae bacterium]|nr:hypothetical protein [Lachnospiraceae bacterium]